MKYLLAVVLATGLTTWLDASIPQSIVIGLLCGIAVSAVDWLVAK